MKNKLTIFAVMLILFALAGCCFPSVPASQSTTEDGEPGGSSIIADAETTASTFTFKPIVNSANLLENPGFERGSEDQPEGWTTTGWKPGEFLWDSTVAHSGRYSVKIDAPKVNDLQWAQQVNVLPNSKYRFTAWVRTLDVGHSLEVNDAGANLSVDGAYSWSENLKGTNDWTLLSLDIITGPGDSALTFSLRLGGTCGTNTGIVWFDDTFLELVEEGGDTNFAVFKGQHVTLMLFKSDAEMISDIPGWLQQLDMAYELLEELVGSNPYDGENITVREVLPCWFGGLSGNPILINQQILQIEKFKNPNDLDFGVIHELSHDFDMPPYSEFYIGDGAINAEGWSNLKVVYVADQMAALFPEATFGGDGSAYLLSETGSNFEKKYAQPYLQACRLDGMQMNNDVLTGLLYLLKRQIGWEPFKATFRDYQTYSIENSPVSNSNDKINLFVTLLSKNSGVDLSPAFRSWGFDIE
jgi:hypothetical protein